MLVRHAVLEDVGEVHAIANSLRINWEYPQRDGFLVYVPTEDEYRRRTMQTRFFYVGEEDHHREGFLMCYDDETLFGMEERGEFVYEDGVVQAMLRHDVNFVFGDQIGVTHKGRRLGTAMMEQLFRDVASSGLLSVYVAMLEEPVRNTASSEFVASLGFEPNGTARNRDATVWRIYRKGVGQTFPL